MNTTHYPALADTLPSFALPGLELFSTSDAQLFPEATQELSSKLERVLADYGVRGKVTSTARGPFITQLLFDPQPGTRTRQVIALSADVARMMRVQSARICVVPGSTELSIEIPHVRPDTVRLGDMLAAPAFQSFGGHLPFIVGSSVTGEAVYADLAEMPHLLMAGTTGSGKSVGMHALLISLLTRLTSDQLQIMLIDPKMLEFTSYAGIPHLVCPVLTDPVTSVDALDWIVEEMDRRYRLMGQLGVRDLVSYNGALRDEHLAGMIHTAPLPRIVVAVDELADLMLTSGKRTEGLIQRIAQKARAAGIHMVLATQRPSTDVITGVIKANLPSRISYSVTTGTDSRCVLGQMGAEHLLGRGDALLMRGKSLERVHGAFVSDGEIRAVGEFLREQVQ